MVAGEHLNTIQFADESGERSLDMTGKHIMSVPIKHIREGMIHRPSWNRDMPFRSAHGDAIPDPDHPAAEDGHTPYVIPYKRTFSPHTDEDTPYHVVVRKKKSGIVAVRAPNART
jgi:hypothetical protein